MKVNVSPEISQKIRNMSLLCAFLVVSIHVIWPHEQPLSVGWFMHEAVSEGIAKIAVPFFFIVSGFFLAQHFDEEGWWGHEVGKRIKSLLVPFVCWSVIACASSSILSMVADLLAHRPWGTNVILLRDDNLQRLWGLDLTRYPLYGPLWYVRCLLLFVLTGFIFKKAVRKYGLLWLAATFMFSLLFDHIPSANWREFFRMGYSASGMFYFSTGIFLQNMASATPRMRRDTSRSLWMAVASGLVGLAFLAFRLAAAYNAWRFYLASGKLSIPFLIYFVWYFMPSVKIPQWLTDSSFPIFLIHGIILGYVNLCMRRCHIFGLPSAFIHFAGGCIVPIGIMLLLRRRAPGLAGLLFGGR